MRELRLGDSGVMTCCNKQSADFLPVVWLSRRRRRHLSLRALRHGVPLFIVRVVSK